MFRIFNGELFNVNKGFYLVEICNVNVDIIYFFFLIVDCFYVLDGRLLRIVYIEVFKVLDFYLLCCFSRKIV